MTINKPNNDLLIVQISKNAKCPGEKASSFLQYLSLGKAQKKSFQFI
jgi:subtilase family serine protease